MFAAKLVRGFFMRRRIDHNPDVSHEPHLRGRDADPEDCDMLEDEPARASEVQPGTYEESVSDEPSLSWRKFDRQQTPGFAEHLERMRNETSPAVQWLVVLGAALFAGPFAVFGAFFKAVVGEQGWGYIAVVVIGPVIEEMLKVVCAIWLVERKPWLLPGMGAIILIGATAGLSFAAIENWVYLNVYFPDHGPDLVQWRWTAGVALHVGCSIIAAWGVAKMWRAVIITRRPADLSIAFGWIVTAILIHGVYNAVAVIIEIAGIGPA
jgi:hypothetical protein